MGLSRPRKKLKTCDIINQNSCLLETIPMESEGAMRYNILTVIKNGEMNHIVLKNSDRICGFNSESSTKHLSLRPATCRTKPKTKKPIGKDLIQSKWHKYTESVTQNHEVTRPMLTVILPKGRDEKQFLGKIRENKFDA